MRSIKRDRRLGALLIPAVMLLTAAGCTGQTQADPSISTSNEALTTLSISGTATGPQGALSGATITLTTTATPDAAAGYDDDEPERGVPAPWSPGYVHGDGVPRGVHGRLPRRRCALAHRPQPPPTSPRRARAAAAAARAAGRGRSTGGGGTGGGGAGSGGAGTGGGGGHERRRLDGALARLGAALQRRTARDLPGRSAGRPRGSGVDRRVRWGYGNSRTDRPIGQMGNARPDGADGLTGSLAPFEGRIWDGCRTRNEHGRAVPVMTGVPCRVGEMILTAGFIGHGIPARGQTLNIADSPNLFSVIGTAIRN